MTFVSFSVRSRLGAVIVAAAVLVPAAFALTGPSAQAAGVPADATAAADWLGAQITTNGGSLPGFAGPDIGLTEDAVLALTAAGQGESDPARAATAQIAADITDFVSFDHFGIPDVHLSGALAKSLLVTEVQGADPTSFGGRNLESELRGTLTTSGASAGRFSDQGTTDTSNGFGQALAILGLLRTSGGVPASAVTYLLAQQCPAGGFRLFYDSGTSCTADASADTDATGLTVQALAALPASAAVTAAMNHAVAWLQTKQNASTGSFNGSGPTDVPNTNSTGLATLALRLAGDATSTTAADKGAAYVAAQQLGSGTDAGAIGYDAGAKAAATGGTIGDSDLDQFRRATVQAILGLGLPSYGQIVAVPTAPTTSPTTSPTTTPTSTTTSPTTSPSSTTATSTTSSTTSATATVSGTSATTSTSGATVLGERTSAVSGLARTGGVAGGLVLVGLLALLLGIGLTVAATDRAAKHR